MLLSRLAVRIETPFLTIAYLPGPLRGFLRSDDPQSF